MLSSRLSEHIHKIDQLKKDAEPEEDELSGSDLRRKSQAMYRTAGEQVAHVMFGRKSTYNKESSQLAKTEAKNRQNPHEFADKSNEVDPKQDKEYFVSR